MRVASQVETIITEAEREVEGLKQTQFAGADNVEITVSSSDDLYDASVVVADGDNESINVEFAASTQDYPIAILVPKVYMDGTDEADVIMPGILGFGDIDIISEPRETGTPGSVFWRIQIWNYTFSSHTYYVKVYIQHTAGSSS